VEVRYVPANHDLLAGAWEDPAVEALRRFSRGYFTVSREPDGSLAVHDLRFGRSDLGLTDAGRYIFTFRLQRNSSGRMTGFTRTDPQIDARSDLIQRFVQRVRGNETVVGAAS
jgi:inner membrane protein